MSEQAATVCDVVGCEKPSSATYVNAQNHPGYRFFVCARHQERRLSGEQPVIATERSDLGQMHAAPALIME